VSTGWSLDYVAGSVVDDAVLKYLKKNGGKISLLCVGALVAAARFPPFGCGGD
jgi:hypothetical protein